MCYRTAGLGPQRVTLVLLLSVWWLSLLAWASAWRWSFADLPGGWWLFAVAGLLLTAWGIWQLRHPVAGVLSWEPPAPDEAVEGRWRWESPAYRRGASLEAVTCHLDLQSLILLRLITPAGIGVWVWLHASTDVRDWLPLRRAVRAHAGQSRPTSDGV